LKHLPDIVIALVFAAALTYADRIFVSGPYMGMTGVALSVVAALVGWVVAKLGARLFRQRYQTGVTMFTIFAGLLFLGLAYVKLFDLTKVDYTATDVFYHLLIVALAAFTVRMVFKSVEIMSD